MSEHNHNEAVIRKCSRRHLNMWCLRRMNESMHGEEGNILPGRSERRPEMPLTDADIPDHSAKTGRAPEDLLCRAVRGLPCPYGPDYHSGRRTLFFDGVGIREFYRDAEIQIAILEVIQAEGWPRRSENVLPRAMPWEPSHRLSDAIRQLNQNQKRVEFSVEKGTQAVLWKPIDEARADQAAPANPSDG